MLASTEVQPIGEQLKSMTTPEIDVPYLVELAPVSIKTDDQDKIFVDLFVHILHCNCFA